MSSPVGPHRPTAKKLIGHRGASAYAPENTLPAFDLALRQGADTLETDLQVTRDGVLVCLHDRTLERTTNVGDVFPERARTVHHDGQWIRCWFVHDFTVRELKQLDAGSWFAPSCAGAAIPTFQELVDFVGDRGELLAELKDPDVYETLGIDLLQLFEAAVRRNGMGRTDRRGPRVTAQSFHEPTLRRAAARFDGQLPWVLLIEPADAHRWATPERVRAMSDFAVGMGPGKAALEACPAMVGWAHACGLRVTPWTFCAASPGHFDSVRDEMAYFLADLDVDAVITNNPDQCPRELLARSS